MEAQGRRALAGEARGLAVRLAHAVNRRLGRRGRVFADRYHARKHGQVMRQVDLCSSAPGSPVGRSGWRRWGPIALDEA